MLKIAKCSSRQLVNTFSPHQNPINQPENANMRVPRFKCRPADVILQATSIVYNRFSFPSRHPTVAKQSARDYFDLRVNVTYSPVLHSGQNCETAHLAGR